MNKMSVDDFLAMEAVDSTVYTIQPVANRDGYVSIALVGAHDACNCGNAIEIPKGLIASVKPVGTHECCGKSLRTGKITFHDNASLSVAEVLKQAARKSTSSGCGCHSDAPQQGMGQNFQQMGGGPIVHRPLCSVCDGVCDRYGNGSSQCRNCRRNCILDDNPGPPSCNYVCVYAPNPSGGYDIIYCYWRC